MFKAIGLLAIAAVVGVAGMTVTAGAAEKSSAAMLARGKYLVTLGGCDDCHTPGHFLGKQDPRFLGGSEVGFQIPSGTYYGPNLTPDKETGLGNWTRAQIVAAITEGKTPQGRELAPIMPWRDFAHLTKYDANSVAAFLQSLPPVHNQVPGPFGPNQQPTSFVMKVVPPGAK